jgi:hypothetical protein
MNFSLYIIQEFDIFDDKTLKQILSYNKLI